MVDRKAPRQPIHDLTAAIEVKRDDSVRSRFNRDHELTYIVHTWDEL